jgi:hypothetical protein
MTAIQREVLFNAEMIAVHQVDFPVTLITFPSMLGSHEQDKLGSAGGRVDTPTCGGDVESGATAPCQVISLPPAPHLLPPFSPAHHSP